MINRLIISTLVLFQFSILFSSSPFGTVKLNDSTFLDETEIDVGSWLSYYTWVLGHKDYESAKKIIPDSSAVEPELWIYINKISTDYIDNFASYTLQPIGYFGKECKECSKFGKRLPTEKRFCAMLDFPITGLSYEQVIGFCEWRTKVEGENKFIFRLPTPDEWKAIALKGLSEPERKNGFRDSMNNKNCAYYNYDIKCACVNADIQGKLLSVGMYAPEKTGAFDLFGNVSEMTSVKGIAKGGNFKLFAIQCHPDSAQFYSKPEIWLGFRCIVIKKKKK